MKKQHLDLTKLEKIGRNENEIAEKKEFSQYVQWFISRSLQMRNINLSKMGKQINVFEIDQVERLARGTIIRQEYLSSQAERFQLESYPTKQMLTSTQSEAFFQQSEAGRLAYFQQIQYYQKQIKKIKWRDNDPAILLMKSVRLLK